MRKIKKKYISIIISVLATLTFSLAVYGDNPVELNYQISGIEKGGYEGTVFCNVINKTDYIITDNSITIHGKGPYSIKINKMTDTFSPYEYPEVKLILRIRFENKNNTYADVLYIGDDDNSYTCHGGM